MTGAFDLTGSSGIIDEHRRAAGFLTLAEVIQLAHDGVRIAIPARSSCRRELLSTPG
jgi:hypothetical protein